MRQPLRVIDIQVAVANRLDVPLTVMRGQSRYRRPVRARQLAMFLCRELTGRSYQEIGWHFGNRNHATVVHAVRMIPAFCASEPELGEARDELRAYLRDLPLTRRNWLAHDHPQPSA